MPLRKRPRRRASEHSGERRILEAIRTGFAGQARAAGQILKALGHTAEGLDRVGHRLGDIRLVLEEHFQNTEQVLVRLTSSVDRLAGEMVTSFGRLHEAMIQQGRLIAENNRRIEEQGVRLEAIGRRIDENTAAIRENTAAIVRLAEAIRRSAGDGQPGGAGA